MNWKMIKILSYTICLIMFSTSNSDSGNNNSEINTEIPLYKSFEGDFLIGTVLNRAQIYAVGDEVPVHIDRHSDRGYSIKWSVVPDRKGLDLALNHFNQLTSENVLKWEEVQPKNGEFDFEASDRFVKIAESNDMHITGHTLVWHNQTPDWVFLDSDGNHIGRERLLARMRDHIHTVVGRYAGRIHSWDVVNEALIDDGSYRESLWYEIIGTDYIAKAFKFAREADPNARLYYNDYNLEVRPAKRQGVIEMIEYLIKKNVPIDGIGTQSHFHLVNFPSLEDVEQTILDLAEFNLEIMVTELDINVLPPMDSDNPDPYKEGLPEEVQQELAERYQQLFEIYLKHRDLLSRVTFWGHVDSDSWRNYDQEIERTNYPLLFDRSFNPKPAFFAIKGLKQ
jgi:endo-1,4-beta-xylanase